MSSSQLGDTATLLSDALRHVEHGYGESNAIVLARCTRIAALGVAAPVVDRARHAMGTAFETTRQAVVASIVAAMQDIERVRTETVDRPEPSWLLPEPLSGPPSKLVLEHEILKGTIESVLLLHTADDWRLDDLLRQGRWLTSLDVIRPKRLDLATHASYLPLFATDGRVSRLIDASAIHAASLQAYDLVVIPSAGPPPFFDSGLRRALYVWDDGWAYARRGAVIAAKGMPHTSSTVIRLQDRTALPPSEQLTLDVPASEARTIGAAVRDVFGNDRPVVVYNPAYAGLGASTGAVRWTTHAGMSPDDHAAMIRAVREHLPTHNILLASVMRPGDARHLRIQEILHAVPDIAGVKEILDLEQPSLTTLRGFSQLLRSSAVEAMVGTTHPTNTHLGASLGLPSFMVGNDTESFLIQRATTGDTGFFTPVPRWPEASPTVGVYHLDTQWGPADLGHAAHAFATHVKVHTEGAHHVFDDVAAARNQATGLLRYLREGSPSAAVTAAKGFADGLRDNVRDVYTNIAAGVARMRLQPGFTTVNSLHDLLNLSRGAAEQEVAAVRDIIQGSMLHKLASFVAAPQSAAPFQLPNANIFRKVRANVPLTSAELSMLGVQDEQEFAEQLRDLTAGHMASTARRPGLRRIQVGWQHLVTFHKDTVVKSLSTNTASEYLTDEYTLQSIRDALGTAGGLVPPTSGIVDGNVVSARMTLFTEAGGEMMSSLFGGRPVGETTLPLGWVDEQFENYVDLAKQGVFNFDYKFKDVGVDATGVLQVADYSAFTRIDRARPGGGGPVNMRTDVYHMGINELIRNGQSLGEFANGDQLTSHFLDLVDRRVGIDLSPYLEGWEWGDHGNPEIVPLAERLREFVEGHGSGGRPLPVYPLVDADAERLVYDHITERLLQR